MNVSNIDLEQAATRDFRALKEAAKRLEARLCMYTGWRGKPGGQDAYCTGKDELFEIQKHIKRLESAMRDM